MKEVDDYCINTTATKHETRTESLELTPNNATIKFTTKTSKGGTFEKFEVAISKESLQSLLEEMAKSPAVEIRPLVWYTSVRDVPYVANLVDTGGYWLIVKRGKTIETIWPAEVTSTFMEKLIKDKGAWLLAPTRPQTIEEANVNQVTFETYDASSLKVRELRSKCFNTGLMVTTDAVGTPEEDIYFTYKNLKREDIHILSEEDADEFCRITAAYSIPSFEDSNEMTVAEEEKENN